MLRTSTRSCLSGRRNVCLLRPVQNNPKDIDGRVWRLLLRSMFPPLLFGRRYSNESALNGSPYSAVHDTKARHRSCNFKGLSAMTKRSKRRAPLQGTIAFPRLHERRSDRACQQVNLHTPKLRPRRFNPVPAWSGRPLGHNDGLECDSCAAKPEGRNHLAGPNLKLLVLKAQDFRGGNFPRPIKVSPELRCRAHTVGQLCRELHPFARQPTPARSSSRHH